MKIAIVSESPADEAIVKVFVEAILDTHVDLIEQPIRPRGWPSVIKLLPAITRHLHYRTPAQALVVVVDSDHTPPINAHDDARGETQSRLAAVRECLDETVEHLKPLPRRKRMATAVGLAVPAIEAWLLCGTVRRASEDAWMRFLKRHPHPARLRGWKRGLKRRLYGTSRPTVRMSTVQGVIAAEKQVRDLARMRQRFEIGFGALIDDLRRW